MSSTAKQFLLNFKYANSWKTDSLWYLIIVAHGAYEYISLCPKLIAMYPCANGGLWYATEWRAAISSRILT